MLKAPFLAAIAVFICTITSAQYGNVSDMFRVKVGVEYGYSHRIAKVYDAPGGQWESHYYELKSGKNFTVNASVPITKNMGIGAIYGKSEAANDCDCRVELAGDLTRFFSERVELSNYGLTYRVFVPTLNGVWLGEIDLGLAYHQYKSDFYAESINNQYMRLKFNGDTAGWILGVGGSVKVVEHVHIGIGLRMFTGLVSSMELEDINGGTQTLNLDPGENISRIDINGGIYFSL